MNPIRVIPLFQISFQRTVDGLFRINSLLNAFPADLCQPTLEWLRFRRRNRLDDAKKLFGIRYIGETALSVRGDHFQLLTICQQFICTFFLQTLLEFGPIVACAASGLLICQNSNNIYNREIPLFFFLIPCRADLLIFKKLNFILFAHSVAILSLSFFDYTSANSLPQEF